MARRGPPRAYVTSAFHINFHADENQLLPFEHLSQFLISAGKLRQTVGNKLKSQQEAAANENPLPSSSSSGEAFPYKVCFIFVLI